MRILFASSEVAPFIKTGGLADVAGSLPKALAQEGHDVKVILPLYEGVGEQWRSQMKFEQYYNVTLSWRHVYCGVFSLEQDGVTYWFVDNEYYFKRWQLYGHFDDCERFAYFSRAVIETPGHFGWAPDIIHCNDWQTALVPVYMLEERYHVPELANTKTVFTIHNIEYQGRYGDQVLEDVIGLDRSYLNEGMLGYYKDPEATAEVIDADGWFHTGDLARMDEEGFYYITGRKKNLIILASGENVSPEELEKKLALCPAITECIVKEKGQKICAVIYCPEDKQEEVRAFVTEVNRSLPLYKRISAVEFTAEPLPRNALGKLLRK